MARWSRFVTGVDGVGVVYAFGGLYVALAVRRTVLVATTGRPILAAGLDFLLVGVPGGLLLYGGYRFRKSEIRRETRWRVGAWSVLGLLVMVGGVELIILEPGVTVEHPLWAYTLGSAVGTLGGFVVGVYDARAVTQAREAERHNRTLESQNERLESFASMLAHEVRNPLNIAQIYVPQAAAGDEDAAEEVETALERIEEMVDVLFVIAKGTDADIDREPVELSAVAAAAWEDLSTATGRLDVTAERTVLADPVHLRHLLENLFKNSLEHGSGRVTVRVGDLPTGFYVADDGPGISATERETVFDAGYTTDADGMGLGLTFVSQLVETYGWDCEVTESATGGARFEFRDVDLVSTDQRQVH